MLRLKTWKLHSFWMTLTKKCSPKNYLTPFHCNGTSVNRTNLEPAQCQSPKTCAEYPAFLSTSSHKSGFARTAGGLDSSGFETLTAELWDESINDPEHLNAICSYSICCTMNDIRNSVSCSRYFVLRVLRVFRNDHFFFFVISGWIFSYALLNVARQRMGLIVVWKSVFLFRGSSYGYLSISWFPWGRVHTLCAVDPLDFVLRWLFYHAR